MSGPRQGQATGGEMGQGLHSFERLDALYTDRGKSLEDAIHLIAWMAEQSLCRPAHNTFVTTPALGRF
jgi:hypothetical protein